MDPKDVGKTVSEIVDSLYYSFLARDFFGKVVPGAVLIGGMLFALGGGAGALTTLSALPAWCWPIAYGVSWIAGFMGQAAGEWVHLLRSLPKDETREGFYARLKGQMHTTVNRQEVLTRERLVVIKEAMGNTSVALGVTAIAMIGARMLDGLSILEGRFLLGEASILLGFAATNYFHREHIERQRIWEVTAPKQADKALGEGDAGPSLDGAGGAR